MKNRDLLKLKIRINTNNDITLQEMALLLDKPEFLKMLPDLRKIYRIKELISLDEYPEYAGKFIFETHFNDEGKIDLSKYKSVSELRKWHPLMLGFLENEVMRFPDRLNAECNLICFEFKRPYFFSEIIRQAMFCGAVDDSYYAATQAAVVDASEMAPWEYSLPQAAIFVSRNSTYENVKEEFRKVKKLIKTDKRLSYYQQRADTVTNIRKYRHWYWETIKGKRYSQISNDWIEKHPDDEPAMDETFIIKGVTKYKELLTL